MIYFRSAPLYTFGIFFAAASAFAQGNTTRQTAVPAQPAPKSQRDDAKEQLKQQEHQRILRVLPNFNTSNVQNAAPLSPKQKFHLALRSAVDPVQFAITAADAGLSQLNNSFPGYGQGMEGYGKRYGAAYADSFDGTLLSGAVFPVLLHQDPRYFRKGTGTVKARLWYAIRSTVVSKGDNGKWEPNYSNILGNLAAGGIANLYYPSSDRGAELTFQRAFIVTAEGSLGSIFVEFWPDISRKLQHRKSKTSTIPEDAPR